MQLLDLLYQEARDQMVNVDIAGKIYNMKKI
jgi:hypothetical protein